MTPPRPARPRRDPRPKLSSAPRLAVAALALPALAGLTPLAHPTVAAAAPPPWHLGTPPLTTPWTADASPATALPEYPRPQLQRAQWQSLNGVWQFDEAAVNEAPPVGRDLT